MYIIQVEYMYLYFINSLSYIYSFNVEMSLKLFIILLFELLIFIFFSFGILFSTSFINSKTVDESIIKLDTFFNANSFNKYILIYFCFSEP